MRLEPLVGALLWAVLMLYVGYGWLKPKKTPTYPVQRSSYYFKYGYDPYNTVDAYKVYGRVIDIVQKTEDPRSAHNLRRHPGVRYMKT